MKKTDMILYEMNNLDIYEMTSEQLEFVTDTILDGIKISDLEDKIHQVTLQLSHIGPAKFGSELKPLFLEDEARLNLIYLLNYNFDNFKADFKYIKKHRLDEDIDGERLFSFIMKLKDVVGTVYEYGEFTIQQQKEQAKYLEEQHKEWVKLMEAKAEQDRKQLNESNKN